MLCAQDSKAALVPGQRRAEPQHCWKGARDIIESNSLLKHVLYNRSHRRASRWALSISTEGDSATSPGSLLLRCHPYRKEVLPHVSVQLPVFKTVTPCPIATRHQAEPGLIHFTSLWPFINTNQTPSQTPLEEPSLRTGATQPVGQTGARTGTDPPAPGSERSRRGAAAGPGDSPRILTVCRWPRSRRAAPGPRRRPLLRHSSRPMKP